MNIQIPTWTDPKRLPWELDQLAEKFGRCDITPPGYNRLVTIHQFPLPERVWRAQEFVSRKPNHLGGFDTRYEPRDLLTHAKVYFVVPCSYPGPSPCGSFFTQPMDLANGCHPRGTSHWEGCWSVDYNISIVPSGSQWWRLDLHRWDGQRDTLLTYARVIKQRLWWDS